MNLEWKIYHPEQNNNAMHIVMAHGFGANMHDLYPIGQVCAPKQRWLFPQAPIELQHGSYAWFPSDANDMQEVFRGSYFSNIADRKLDELDLRSDQLIDDCQELGIIWERTYLGGFSQGSMLALRAWARHALPLKGLMLLSSSLVDRVGSEQLLANAPKVPIFQSHGKQDDILPYDSAVSLKNLLERTGHQVEFHSFTGGHGIPESVVQRLSQIIRPE